MNNEAAGDYTISIASGSYIVESMPIDTSKGDKNITIKASDSGKVYLSSAETVNSSNVGIFTINSNSNYHDSTILISGINFDLTNVTDKVLSAVTTGTGNERYAQNITLEYCTFEGVNDHSYAVYINADAGVNNTTIRNCTGNNIRGLYGNYGDNIVIENCTLTNSKSIVNSGSAITDTDGDYNLKLINITADIKADIQDKIYAIRVSGGKTLIDNCDVTMTYHSPDSGSDCVDYGLLVLRDKDNVVDIKNSTLNAITEEGSVKKAYAIYQEDEETTTATINVENSNLIGGLKFDRW